MCRVACEWSDAGHDHSMDTSETLPDALARLNLAIADAKAAEFLADRRSDSADRRIMDADARIYDADQQTAHAKSGIAAADAHMESARAHMADADARAQRADSERSQAQLETLAARARTADADRDSAEALLDIDEYQRALHHYQQLVRHRIANPLQIITGMAHTILERPDLDEDVRKDMIEAICDASKLLERLALFSPERLGQEEHGLRGMPFEE